MLSQMLSAKLPERLGCTGTDVHPQRLQAQRLCRHRKQGLSFRKFPQRVSWELRAAGEEIMLSDVPEPEDARGAITLGLKFSDAGQYEQALQLFLKALKLPGTGIKQFRCASCSDFPTRHMPSPSALSFDNTRHDNHHVDKGPTSVALASQNSIIWLWENTSGPCDGHAPCDVCLVQLLMGYSVWVFCSHQLDAVSLLHAPRKEKGRQLVKT